MRSYFLITPSRPCHRQMSINRLYLPMDIPPHCPPLIPSINDRISHLGQTIYSPLSAYMASGKWRFKPLYSISGPSVYLALVFQFLKMQTLQRKILFDHISLLNHTLLHSILFLLSKHVLSSNLNRDW